MVTPADAAALRLMADKGGKRSARHWRALGMSGAGMKCQVLASLGLATREGALPVLYSASEEGLRWLSEHDGQ